MHMAKVAQLFFRSIHFAVELSEFRILSYNHEIFKLIPVANWLSLHGLID